MDKLYCVISHTHWDREWYQPFEEFRIRLVNLMDNLLNILDKQDNYIFHLDAQTIVLEDYLEIRPDRSEKLKKYIAEGRILVGPWYVQNDFFLVSGEATIRNLLLGIDIAEDFGKSTMVGYAPDQFGLISQLPQIFKKTGLEGCIFGRGYDFNEEEKKAEFWWKGEDGSQVLAVYLPHWYNNAQRFPEDIDKTMQLLDVIIENLEKTSSTNNLLLMNGVDHLEAQEDLLPILENINQRLPEREKIFQDTMPEYIVRLKDSVDNLESYTGEMRNGPASELLNGTLSSRVYLKQYNVQCQTLIESRLEPLSSFVQLLGFDEYPTDYMHYLWKLLIKNHPHDSICGCSKDTVHDQMENRFVRFIEAGEDLLERGMDFISSYISRDKLDQDQYLITVFNTEQNSRSTTLELDIYFPQEEGVEEFKITDEEGREIPYVILDKEGSQKQVLSPINLPGMIDITSYHTRVFLEQVPGLSYRTLILTPGESAEQGSIETANSEANFDVKSLVQLPENKVLENKYLSVDINKNGSINLYHKESQQQYSNLLLLEDREDIGDAYNYRSSENGKTYISEDVEARVEMLEDNELYSSCRISYNWQLPVEYDFESDARSDKLVDFPVEMVLSLEKDSSRLDVSISIDNQCKDHRLRVLMPTGICSNISIAGSPFDAIYRDRTDLTDKIDPAEQHPNNGYINVDDNNYGLAFFNEGLYEYEHFQDDHNTIALTLLRANDYLKRRLTGMAGISNKRWMVPENQCLGEHQYKLAVYPHQGDFLQAGVAEKAKEFLNPVFSYYQSVDTRKFAGGRPFVQGSEIAENFFRDKKYPEAVIPGSGQFFTIDGKDIILSSIKKKEDGDSIILRVYNIAEGNREFNLQLIDKVEHAFLINLREEREESLQIEGNSIKGIEANPKEIITIEILINN